MKRRQKEETRERKRRQTEDKPEETSQDKETKACAMSAFNTLCWCVLFSLFFFSVQGVTPDVLIIAKGLASGYPLAGIATRRELLDKLVRSGDMTFFARRNQASGSTL